MQPLSVAPKQQEQIPISRLSEFLDSIERSTNVLRESLLKEPTYEGSDYSRSTAHTLSLPFHQSALAALHASQLRIACEGLAQLVTPPRHIILEAAGSVSLRSSERKNKLKNDLIVLYFNGP